MRRGIFSLIFVLILSFTIVPTVKCAEFKNIIWAPGASQVLVHVEYPDEAHPGDIITYNLDIYWWQADKLMNEFDFSVNYLRDDGTWHTIYNTNFFTNVQMSMNENRSYSIEIEIPIHTATHPHALQIQFYIQTDNSYSADVLEAYTTHVVSKTRIELQNEINDLSIGDSVSASELVEYKQTHSYTNSEFETLASDFDEYKQDYLHSNSEYDALESQLTDSQPQNDLVSSDSQQYLVYGLIGTTVIFIIMTVYFARKSKNKV